MASGTDHHVLRETGPCLRLWCQCQCLITATGIIKWHLLTVVAAMVACRGDGIQWWSLKPWNPCHFIVVLCDDLYFLGRREGHQQIVKDLARHDEVVSNITWCELLCVARPDFHVVTVPALRCLKLTMLESASHAEKPRDDTFGCLLTSVLQVGIRSVKPIRSGIGFIRPI